MDLVRPAVDRCRSGLVEARQNVHADVADLKRTYCAAIGAGSLDHQFGNALKALSHPDLQHRDIRTQRFATLKLIRETGIKRGVVFNVERGLGKAVTEHWIVKGAAAPSKAFKLPQGVLGKAWRTYEDTLETQKRLGHRPALV